MKKEKVLNFSEFAERAHRSRRTINRDVKSGKIKRKKYTKIMWGISEKELEKYTGK